MPPTTAKTRIIAKLKKVKRLRSSGRYRFLLEDGNGTAFMFLLSENKALVVANGHEEFPTGISLEVEGRHAVPGIINFAKLIAIDGMDPRSWAESVGSLTVAGNVQKAAELRVKEQQEAQDEEMRARAPAEEAKKFSTPSEGFQHGMYIVRRQLRLKDPKLTRTDIFELRDALNIMAEAAGLI